MNRLLVNVPSCPKCFADVQVGLLDQCFPFERIEQLIKQFEELSRCCPKHPTAE